MVDAFTESTEVIIFIVANTKLKCRAQHASLAAVIARFNARPKYKNMLSIWIYNPKSEYTDNDRKYSKGTLSRHYFMPNYKRDKFIDLVDKYSIYDLKNYHKDGWLVHHKKHDEIELRGTLEECNKYIQENRHKMLKDDFDYLQFWLYGVLELPKGLFYDLKYWHSINDSLPLITHRWGNG